MATPDLWCPSAEKPDFGLWGRCLRRVVSVNLRRRIGGGFSDATVANVNFQG
jgi:hypothetical protein